MAQKESNRKNSPEQQALELLKNVLPKAVSDPKVAQKILAVCERELQVKARTAAFEKLCEGCDLPNLDAKSVAEVKEQFEASFGKGTISLVPHPAKQAVSVELVLPDGAFEGVIKVKSGNGAPEDEPAAPAKMAPLPVCLEGDPELVWILARNENSSPEEACRALARVAEDFWGSKTGQKLLRDRVERTFPEFIARVPGSALAEAGLKRHYKEPEPLKVFRTAKPKNRG